MSWQPLSREDLDSMIAAALAEYNDDVRAVWARIRIEPEKWRCGPWGDEGGGFWAVAIEDDRVLWYNDIECGFNRSAFSRRGTIDEYLCNQTELSEVLDPIAHEQHTHVWKTPLDHDVPADLSGPGMIGRRQTTYWELQTATESPYRVHFRDKIEVRIATAEYPRVEVASCHPLLVQYDAPSRSLYFAGTPIDPLAVAEALDQTIRSVSEGWRSIADYSGRVEAALRAGHGLLMDAPEPVCRAIAAVLENASVRTSIVGSAPARTGYSALLLGRSYTIARAFAFERR